MTAEARRGLAREYLALLRRIGPQAARVTDKAPFNHIRLGLIHLLRVPELFRRLAQPARFAQRTEIDPIGPGIARRVRGSWRGVCRAAALLEVTPAATRAGIISAGSFGRRRSGGAHLASSEDENIFNAIRHTLML